MQQLDWYFDFISGYAYLQFEMLDRLPPGTTVAFKPILFAGLLKHHGHKGPGEIPGKRRFTYTQWAWLGERLGIPLTMPPAHPFNPLSALRLALACDCRKDAIQTIFRFIWREGRSVEGAAGVAELGRRLKLADPAAAIAAPAVKAKLRANTEEAVARGLFGVPTFAVDGEQFWGADSTDMLLDYLARPERFRTGEIARVRTLPLGTMRKEVS
jgi:2-hydroxychromene-2-carboxylate isomerase